MNRIWIVLAMALAIVLPACNKKAENKNQLFVSGRIDGDTVDISSKTAGKVTEITVREGDSVKAHQTVARLSSPQDEAQREQAMANVANARNKLDEVLSAAPARVAAAEANLAASQAELVRWQAERHQAAIDAERYPPLVETGAVASQVADHEATRLKIADASTNASQKQVLAAEASLQQSKAQLEQIDTAKATLAANRAELQRIEANVSDLTINAPIDGTILTRSAEPGRVLQPGQTILTMVDMQKLYLRGYIPEGEIGNVKVGQQAKVYLDSNPKEAIPAEVIRIDPEAMFTPENIYFKDDRVKQVFGVKLLLRGAYGLAKPGMPADGNIEIGAQ
jgi:HlyD family secretion protein